MRRNRWCRSAAWCLAGVVFLVGSVRAEPWPVLGKATAAEERIQQALAKETRLEFVETPLEQVLVFLEDQHDIFIKLDKKSLDEAGVASDSPVTKNLKRISLASALHLLLVDLGLTYAVEHEVLWITTQERAAAKVEVRAYDVAPLLKQGLTAEELASALRDVLGNVSGGSGGAVCMSYIPVVGSAEGRPQPRSAEPAEEDPFGGPRAMAPGAPPGADPFRAAPPGAMAQPAAPPPGASTEAPHSHRTCGAMPGFGPWSSPGYGAPPPAPESARRIVALRHLLLVRDTPRGQEQVAKLIGDLAEGLRETGK